MIGETLYTYDTNRLNDDGTKRSNPNLRHYWKAHTVTSETRTSWILGNDEYRVDKKTFELRNIREFCALAPYAFTEQQKVDAGWRELNRRKIIEAVERVDIATLRKIGALLGIE